MLESDPYRRLSYTWHTFTPELAERARPRATRPATRLAAEPRSKVTFEIEPVGELGASSPSSTTASSRSSLVADDDQPAAGRACSRDLKTLLETGDTLPDLGRASSD